MDRQSGADDRILWVDAARGIGILLVVAGHVERGLISAGVAAEPHWAAIDLAIYSFHMALFMLLAGFNVQHSLRRGRGPFLLGKVRSVYHPYVLWSAVQGGLLLLVAGVANSGTTWSDIVQIPWRPIMQFWFLYVLMAYLLAVALVGVRAILLVPLAAAAFIANLGLESLSLLNRLLFYFPFFVGGVLLGPWLISALRTTSWRVALGLAVLAVLGWLAALLALMPRDPLAILGASALPCAVLGSVAVLGLARVLTGRMAALLGWIGQRSLSIFVMHILASAAVRIAVMKVAPGAPEPVFFALCMGAGVALPCLALFLAQRLGIAAWLGLEQSRR